MDAPDITDQPPHEEGGSEAMLSKGDSPAQNSEGLSRLEDWGSVLAHKEQQKGRSPSRVPSQGWEMLSDPAHTPRGPTPARSDDGALAASPVRVCIETAPQGGGAEVTMDAAHGPGEPQSERNASPERAARQCAGGSCSALSSGYSHISAPPSPAVSYQFAAASDGASDGEEFERPPACAPSTIHEAGGEGQGGGTGAALPVSERPGRAPASSLGSDGSFGHLDADAPDMGVCSVVTGYPVEGRYTPGGSSAVSLSSASFQRSASGCSLADVLSPRGAPPSPTRIVSSCASRGTASMGGPVHAPGGGDVAMPSDEGADAIEAADVVFRPPAPSPSVFPADDKTSGGGAEWPALWERLEEMVASAAAVLGLGAGGPLRRAAAAAASTDLAQGVWAWLQKWAAALPGVVPRERAAAARARLGAVLRRAGSNWATLGLSGAMALLAVLAGWTMASNAGLRHMLRRRDREMQQLIIMVLELQERLQGKQRVPIIRHTCSVSSFFPPPALL